jgi:PEP-CTERM motif
MRKIFAVLLAWLAGIGVATAEPITIVTDARTTSAFARLDVAGQTDQQAADQTKGDALNARATAAIGTSFAQAVAGLVSSISDPAHLGGSGHALAAFSTSEQGQASAVARFAVDFLLDQPFVFSFDGSFAASDFPVTPTSAGTNDARWSVALSSGDTFFLERSDTKTALMHDAGVLPAGLSRLVVDTSSSGFFQRAGTVVEDSQFNFNLGLTPLSPTPEPATMTLLGTAIAGLFAARRAARPRRVPRRETIT